MRKRIISLFQKIENEKLLSALVVTVWLFLILTTVSKNYDYFVRQDLPIEIDYILFESFTVWGIAAMFGPLFIWLAKRIPIKASNIYRSVSIHIGLSVAFIPVYVLLVESVMFFSYDFLLDSEETKQLLEQSFLEFFLMGIVGLGVIAPLLYWLIVGGYHFKKSYETFKKRKLTNMQMEAELASIRLRVLKAQLHPHFLFNTLHNVNTLIHEDPPAAERILALLKRFLQLSIQRVNDQQVTLMDEIAFTGTYLKIEKIRFGDRLTTETDIAPSTFDAQVPSLILQPLVENAVRHGISKQVEPGILKVTSEKVDKFLHLTVEDNGPGLDKEAMNTDGVGLRNINQRLNQLYEESGFELKTSSLGGLKVMIKIPFRSTKKTDDDNE